MQSLFKYLFFTLTILVASELQGQNRIQKYIDNEMKTSVIGRSSLVGICVYDEDNEKIACWNDNIPLATASTMKIVTAAVALKVLGADYRFSTGIAYDGEVVNGTLNGDLYIVGGGDPTLGSKADIAYPIDSIFSIWSDALKVYGIQKINGRIIGDDRHFTDIREYENWFQDDLGYYYGCGAQGLSFGENLSYFIITPGIRKGDSVTIIPDENVPSDFKVINYAVTGSKDSGDKIKYQPDLFGMVGAFSGTYEVGKGAKKTGYANRFASLACAESFADYLSAHGISSTSSISSQILSDNGCLLPPSDSLTLVVETFSPTLDVIIKEMLFESNNLYAETLFRSAGMALCGSDDYVSVQNAIKGYIHAVLCNTEGYNQDDGSGLSRKNVISPDFFCRFLSTIAGDEDMDIIMESMPVVGVDGTVKTLLKGIEQSEKERMHIKSGSMSLVRSYCGFVKTNKGTVKFVIMLNNFTASSSAVKNEIEGFLKILL